MKRYFLKPKEDINAYLIKEAFYEVVDEYSIAVLERYLNQDDFEACGCILIVNEQSIFYNKQKDSMYELVIQ